MYGKHNRFAWYEEEKKPISDKKLMIIEYVITDLQLVQDSFPPELRKGPIVVYFKLMDLAPVEFTEEFIREMMVQKECDFYRTGKSCILAISELPEFPPTLIDMEVRINRLVSECACVHEFPLAMSKVDLNPIFRDITNEYKVSPCKVPIIKTQRDWYILTTDESGAKTAGTIDIDIRLSCFDRLAVSQMTIGTQEAVLTIENKGLERPYTCNDFPGDPVKLCSRADAPFHDGDVSRFLLDGMMAIATAGVPDDIDNWIALAQHQGWKPQPRPIVEKAEGEAILSKICPDECEGFKPRYPRPKYSTIRNDTTIPPECTDVCPTYEDAFKPLPICPKKRKRIEAFVKGRKPCHDLCPYCYLEHEPPILPTKFHIPVFPEFCDEDGEGGEDFWLPFPFDHFPFPFEKDEESPSDNPEECDSSCPWYSPEAIAKRKRKSFKFFKDGLRYENKRCPEQCPDCFYDDDANSSSSSSSSKSSIRSGPRPSSLASRSSGTPVSSRNSRNDAKSDSNSISSSSSGSSSSSSSSDKGSAKKKGGPQAKKTQPQEDCKCTMPVKKPKYVSITAMCMSRENPYSARQERPYKHKDNDTQNEQEYDGSPQRQSSNKGRPSQGGNNKRISFSDNLRDDSPSQDDPEQGNPKKSREQGYGRNPQQQSPNRGRPSQGGNNKRPSANNKNRGDGNPNQGNNRGDPKQDRNNKPKGQNKKNPQQGDGNPDDDDDDDDDQLLMNQDDSSPNTGRPSQGGNNKRPSANNKNRGDGNPNQGNNRGDPKQDRNNKPKGQNQKNSQQGNGNPDDDDDDQLLMNQDDSYPNIGQGSQGGNNKRPSANNRNRADGNQNQGNNRGNPKQDSNNKPKGKNRDDSQGNDKKSSGGQQQGKRN